MNGDNVLDISWETIFKISLVGFIFYSLWLVREIIIWIIFALMIALLLNPAIDFLRKLRVPRILGASFVYLSIFGFLGAVIYLSAPIFIYEMRQFLNSFPYYLSIIHPILKEVGIEALENTETFTQALISRLEQISVGIFNALAVFFGGISSAAFILITAFFISLEKRGIERFLILLFPKKYENYVLFLFRRCQKKVSGWFGSRILISLFVGGATFFVLWFFNIKYSFILSLIAGILNLIPYLGPGFTAILIFFLAGVSESWFKAVLVLIAFFLIQQIDGSILSPIFTKKFVGLPPALVLISLVIGAKIFGFLGAVFAIPLAGILYEFLSNFLEKQRREESKII